MPCKKYPVTYWKDVGYLSFRFLFLFMHIEFRALLLLIEPNKDLRRIEKKTDIPNKRMTCFSHISITTTKVVKFWQSLASRFWEDFLKPRTNCDNLPNKISLCTIKGKTNIFNKIIFFSGWKFRGIFLTKNMSCFIVH